tara:strand:+ start:77 stop:403 length:327 start_codon:yes stop_codon:yes gene_type:complete
MKSLKQKQQQSGYNRDALIFRILEKHKTELQEMSNKELVNVWRFTMAVKEQNKDSIPIGSLLDIGLEQGTTEPPDADLQEIKILAEDLVEQARKAGHTITLKQQPETD